MINEKLKVLFRELGLSDEIIEEVFQKITQDKEDLLLQEQRLLGQLEHNTVVREGLEQTLAEVQKKLSSTSSMDEAVKVSKNG